MFKALGMDDYLFAKDDQCLDDDLFEMYAKVLIANLGGSEFRELEVSTDSDHCVSLIRYSVENAPITPQTLTITFNYCYLESD